MDWSNIRYFKPSEFACKHCKGQTDMDFNLIHALDWLRDIFGVPFIVTSGYRCEEHNRAVNGASQSFHVQGKASDITVSQKTLLTIIYKVAIASSKFNGVGLSENKFVHLDTGNRRYYYVYLPEGGTKPLREDVLKDTQKKSITEIMKKEVV